MPRPKNLARPEDLPDALAPLVGSNGPTLATALFALSTWGTSTTFREQLMEQSRFPLAGDLPAFLLVNQLIFRGAARPTDLADAIDTGRSNISKVVSRLEVHGLVQRVADSADNRGVVVALTAEGREVARRMINATYTTKEALGVDWSAEDYEHLERLLIKFVRALDAGPEHPVGAAAGVSLHREDVLA